MNRTHARAADGERAHCTQPFRRGSRINLLGAMGTTGIRALMTVEGTVDADVMEEFCRDVLAPRLRRDDVVVWDNLGSHGMERVTRYIEARGASILRLPPYSPDLNPIELLWSKLKALIRTHAPKTLRDFYRALKYAVRDITRQNSKAWVRHCLVLAQMG